MTVQFWCPVIVQVSQMSDPSLLEKGGLPPCTKEKSKRWDVQSWHSPVFVHPQSASSPTTPANLSPNVVPQTPKEEDLFQLFFQKTTELEASDCLQHNFVGDYGSVLQDPKTLQIRVLRLNVAKLACHLLDTQEEVDQKLPLKILFNFDPVVDALSIYLVNPIECVGNITRSFFAHKDAFGTDLVLRCDSADTLHVIEILSASDWLPQQGSA